MHRLSAFAVGISLLSILACADLGLSEETECADHVDNDGDGQKDCHDADCHCEATDTGVAIMVFAMGGEVDPEEGWMGGYFGNFWYGLKEADDVCDVIGDLATTGEDPETECPDCTWVYNLTVSGTEVDGDKCEDLAYFSGLESFDGLWDGTTYSFGWTDSYYYANVYYQYLFTDVVLVGYNSAWYAFAYNYGDSEQVQGDAYYFQVATPRATYGYYYN